MIDGLRPGLPVDAVFINTPLKDYSRERRFNDITLPVLGLGYVATYAAERGFNVGVLDAEALGLGVDAIVKSVQSVDPAWVGMNLLAPTYELSVRILGYLGSDYQVMLGGHLAKALPQRIVHDSRIPRVDALILGEGELRASAVLGAIDRREVLPGVLWRDQRLGDARVGNGTDLSEPWRAPDIDKLPLLDRRYLKSDPFLAEDGRMEASLVGSRGCPYDCSFCSAAVSVNPESVIRTRSPDSLLGEMLALRSSHEVSAFRFVDDLFLASPAFMRRCLGRFVDEGIADWAVWDANGRINVLAQIREDLLDVVVSTGCREIALGFESGSDRLLQYMGKKIDRQMSERTVTRLTEAGVSVKGYFILGFPTETQADLDATVDLIRSLWDISDRRPGRFRVSAFEFRPYPGTREWSRLIATGDYTEDELLAYEHIDLTSDGTDPRLLDRDEFSYSVNQQFGEVPIDEVRQTLNEITLEQKVRL